MTSVCLLAGGLHPAMPEAAAAAAASDAAAQPTRRRQGRVSATAIALF